LALATLSLSLSHFGNDYFDGPDSGMERKNAKQQLH
jgi:hypothetical protein